MTNKILDLDTLKENYEGDEDLLLSARDTFLENYEVLYEAIGSAAQKGDLLQLSNSSHALKGSTGVFWPRDLQGLLEGVEDADEAKRLEIYNRDKDQIDSLLKQLVDELTALQLQDLVA
jgi:HPt (histidine-containing phosphotransfer) domain-containing protein